MTAYLDSYLDFSTTSISIPRLIPEEVYTYQQPSFKHDQHKIGVNNHSRAAIVHSLLPVPRRVVAGSTGASERWHSEEATKR